MFVKITRSGPRRYVQLVEAFRDPQGAVRHRHVANLGRLDAADGQLDRLIEGLKRTWTPMTCVGHVWTDEGA